MKQDSAIVQTYRGKDINEMTIDELRAALTVMAKAYEKLLVERMKCRLH